MGHPGETKVIGTCVTSHNAASSFESTLRMTDFVRLRRKFSELFSFGRAPGLPGSRGIAAESDRATDSIEFEAVRERANCRLSQSRGMRSIIWYTSPGHSAREPVI
jgi:hypothetical protein